MDNRLKTLLALAAIIVALMFGLLIGVCAGIADRIFGGPDPKTIATASLNRCARRTGSSSSRPATYRW